jgi:hypothetical protein
VNLLVARSDPSSTLAAIVPSNQTAQTIQKLVVIKQAMSGRTRIGRMGA